MPFRYSFLFIALTGIMLFSCSRKIYPDRTQFLRDGEATPSVDLSNYKSVQLRPGQDSSLALAVSISGGGHRAANFGLGILLGLEQLQAEENRDILDEVDYLSTVSGGGFAGGAYITALYEHTFFKRSEPFSLAASLDANVRDDLRKSYLTPLLKSNINPLLLFSPIDDGDALEKAIDDGVLGYKRRKREEGGRSIRLGDIFIPKDSQEPVLLPMQIANSTTVNNVLIFPFTPGILDAYGVDGYYHRKRRQFLGPYFNAYETPLSIGIKASGSVPVAISNTTLRSTHLPERPYLHLMDGAMSDNLGFYTAMDVLLSDPASRKALLIVDAAADGNLYTFSDHQHSKGMLKLAASLPGSGMIAARSVLNTDLDDICGPAKVVYVRLGFGLLLENNDAPLPEVIDPKDVYPVLLEKLRTDMQAITDADKQLMYELLTNIGTKYTIRDEEQELLLLTGQYLVFFRKEEIKEALRLNE